ncbi:hypothetical protein JW992_10265 [candidate division KSB1 bacterium]|nr:hypothetical protein [candidate division KSB1 bacterium]
MAPAVEYNRVDDEWLVSCQFTITSKMAHLKSYSATAFDVSRSTASFTFRTQ